MAMGMTPEFHGNIMETSWEYHDNDTENMGTSCIHLRDNTLSLCDFLVAGDDAHCDGSMTSPQMPCHAETLHKSLEIHPDYMKAAQYLPCTAAYHYT